MSFRLMGALLSAGRALVIPKIRSKTLAGSVVVRRNYDGTVGRLHVPYYWAWYYHDGRGPVRVVNSKFLVWFVNPQEDPRLSRGYPQTYAQARGRPLRLSRTAFEQLRRAGKIVVTKTASPVRPGVPDPFFTKGMREFPQVANEVVRREFPAMLVTELKRRGLYRVRIVDRVVIK